ncbi:hypothetical protein STEG23_030603 [Scotinomys teguina]
MQNGLKDQQSMNRNSIHENEGSRREQDANSHPWRRCVSEIGTSQRNGLGRKSLGCCIVTTTPPRFMST